MSIEYKIPILPLSYDLESKTILRQLNISNKKLAELKGFARTIPNENILVSTLTLQEAKESSEVENIITTQDELYKAQLNIKKNIIPAATKEVLDYRDAIQHGFSRVKERNTLSNKIIKEIQERLEHNNAGYRALPGTALKNSAGETVYIPPQNAINIKEYMDNLETFINDSNLSELDPLIKMAVIHHQFESIHPFYDGNGRTGRIINVLYLVLNNLLDLPILYLSRFITHNKAEYYRLIQAIRDKEVNNQKEWEDWILFILKGVEVTAEETIQLIVGISKLMSRYKVILRPLFGKLYKHELLNNIFFHPYTKIEFMERDMGVKRKTAAKYLENIVESGLLTKTKVGRENYYINHELIELFLYHSKT